MDESVIAALQVAVDGDPTNAPLRAHLGSLLLDGGQYEEAWVLATTGLQSAPANVELLSLAAESGLLSGHDAEAAGYQALLDALGGSDATLPPTPPAEPPTESPKQESATDERVPLAAPGPVPDSAEELVDMWGDTEAMPDPDIGELSRDRLLLSDVGGMQEVKDRLYSSFITPMRNPEIQKAFGKKMRGGLLLWGPPGCGKTFIAKAIAGELDANFYSVGLSDVLDMWLGSSEQNIKEVFDVARANAPCVLFLDEVDALGQKRSNLRVGGGAMRNVVNSLLQEMDGATSDNEGVFVLAATNHPWDIDAALMRPGRIDRTLLVLPPDETAREAIFGLHLRERPTEKLRLNWCAKHSDQLTGADIALVCEEATELAMAESLASGTVMPITMSHLQQALKGVHPSYKQWAETAKNYAMFNNASGNYDDLLRWLKKNRF